MRKNLLETITGLIVLLIAAVFMVFAYEGSEMNVEGNHFIEARFSNATGLNTGSDVRIGGVKIGIVSALALDTATYEAIATMSLREGVMVPKDSTAAIVSSGLLGDKFVQITPGADEEMLAKGGRIEFTQSSVSLEELIGKFVFSGGGVDEKSKPASNASDDISLP